MKASNRYTVKDYFAEPFRFGGELKTRSEIIADLKGAGGSPEQIALYLFGLDRSKRLSRGQAMRITIKDTKGKAHAVGVIEVTEFLAIHRAIEDDDLYAITHTPTGKQVALSESLEGARAILTRLSQVGIDWNFTSSRSRQYRNAGAIVEHVLGR